MSAGGEAERAMNKRCEVLLWAAVLLCGPVFATAHPGMVPAGSQSVAQAPTPKDEPVLSSKRTINLTEENRYIIREIVLKDPNVHKQSGAKATIGDPLPQGIAVQPFPAEVSQKIPSLRSLSFFVTDESVVIVDPKDNRVADIVKKPE
jgi:hypothetical protein